MISRRGPAGRRPSSRVVPCNCRYCIRSTRSRRDMMLGGVPCTCPRCLGLTQHSRRKAQPLKLPRRGKVGPWYYSTKTVTLSSNLDAHTAIAQRTRPQRLRGSRSSRPTTPRGPSRRRHCPALTWRPAHANAHLPIVGRFLGSLVIAPGSSPHEAGRARNERCGRCPLPRKTV